MLLELAGFLKNLGRSSEAKGLFEESVEILGRRWKSSPLDYFIALNNQAAYLITIQDWVGAQHILEKVLDLTLFWSKGGIKHAAPSLSVQSIEFILHLNLVILFVRIEELDLAADHLEKMDVLFSQFSKSYQKRCIDYYHGVRALLLHAEGRFKIAAHEIDKAKNPENPLCLSVRAKLNLAQGDFAEAEQLFCGNTWPCKARLVPCIGPT